MASQEQIERVISNEKAKFTFQHAYITSLVLQPITFWMARKASNKGVNPNYLTLGMLLSVVLAIPCFFCPSPYAYLIGFLLLQFFEIFDDADGIVARATNQLSPYGEQLDYLMHLICHPLLILTYGYVVFQLIPDQKIWGFEKLYVLLVFFGILFLVEVSMRSLIELSSISRLKRPDTVTETKPLTGFSYVFRCCYNQISFCLTDFPVFALLIPIFFVIDGFLHLNLSFYAFVIYTSCSLLHELKMLLSYCILFVNYRSK